MAAFARVGWTKLVRVVSLDHFKMLLWGMYSNHPNAQVHPQSSKPARNEIKQLFGQLFFPHEGAMPSTTLKTCRKGPLRLHLQAQVLWPMQPDRDLYCLVLLENIHNVWKMYSVKFSFHYGSLLGFKKKTVHVEIGNGIGAAQSIRMVRGCDRPSSPKPLMAAT